MVSRVYHQPIPYILPQVWSIVISWY